MKLKRILVILLVAISFSHCACKGKEQKLLTRR